MAYENYFTALSDPTRRQIFENLSKQPLAVGVLAQSVPVSRPAVSQHLKVLTDAGLVTMRKQGRTNIYAVRREGLAELRAYLDQLWGDVLTEFANEIENPKGDHSMTKPIVKAITVNCSAQAAFDVFVRNTSSWWPLDRHAVSAQSGKPAQAITIEPAVDGAVYETMHDGTRGDWGRVLVFEPGQRFSMTWHPGSDPASPTEVSVNFEDLPGGQCRVELTHSKWENWAERADEMRGNYNGGWDHVFGTCFAQAAQDKAA